jgi:hypothetical protein
MGQPDKFIQNTMPDMLPWYFPFKEKTLKILGFHKNLSKYWLINIREIKILLLIFFIISLYDPYGNRTLLMGQPDILIIVNSVKV